MNKAAAQLFRRMRGVMFLSALAGGLCHPAIAQLPDGVSPVPSFSENFTTPLDWCAEHCHGERWRTKYFHSGDTPLARGLGLNGSETEVFVDPEYLHLGVDPFRQTAEGLSLLVRPADARMRAAVQASWPPAYAGPKPAPRFTAGMLTTELSFRQRYGYFEARIKVPRTPGAWPAFWLLGDSGSADEIDVFEILSGQPTRQYFGHQWTAAAGKQSQRGSDDTADLSREFHDYGVLWTASAIVYYRDGVALGRFANPGLNRPMYMLVSMGMDGDWNRQQGFVAAADASADMTVAFVRAYRADPRQ